MDLIPFSVSFFIFDKLWNNSYWHKINWRKVPITLKDFSLFYFGFINTLHVSNIYGQNVFVCLWFSVINEEVVYNGCVMPMDKTIKGFRSAHSTNMNINIKIVGHLSCTTFFFKTERLFVSFSKIITLETTNHLNDVL